MNKLTKHNPAPLAQPMTPAEKPITVKHVMLLDTGDGAFIDESVKVKPHKTDDRKLVLKCVDPKRLLNAMKRMGLVACGPMTKGSKHYILFVWKAAFGEKLLAQQGVGGNMLGAKSASAPVPHLAATKAKALVGKKG